MPINLNGKYYQLCLLDTGIISEILKNKNSELNIFVKDMTENDLLPCITLWNILEIRNREDIYSKFLDIFSIIPLVLLKDSYNIFLDEIDKYPDPSKINPIVHSFSMFNNDKSTHLKPFLNTIFENKNISESEKAWNSSWKLDSLKSILSLKDNFTTKGKNYNSSDALRFIEEGVPQYIISRATEWSKEKIAEESMIITKAFPSVKMAFYTVFYRFYAEKRHPESQDVFDILIGNIAPYVDMVITEKFQAEIFNKVKRIDKFIEHLDIRNINAIR